ncbi:MAG: hypothetical protein QOE58_1904 [Actinomycetota bacterium]|nr:hypothetical protein [Actinomycetota bacterium]
MTEAGSTGHRVRYLVGPDEWAGQSGRPALDQGANWARFGDRMVTWVPASRQLGRGAHSADRLLLVTQVGRAFQDEHPEAHPVLTHGRHLVVTDNEPSLLDSPPNDCWRVETLPKDAVVIDIPAASGGRTDPEVTALLGELSSSRYLADVNWLAGLPNRHSLSAHFSAAAGWGAALMSGLGYTATQVPITVGAATSKNVVGDRAGIGPGPRGLVLVTAHLDSINLAGGPSASAPGADDNASGSAGVLELGRVLSAHLWQNDLRLILFGGEEEGLHGSLQYVATLSATDRNRIRAVLNMDMIATRNTPTATVLLEGAKVSSDLINELATAAATYTTLRVETSLSPFASDHVPFINAGLPAVLTIEGADSANGHIHTANDLLTYVDPTLAMEILRMNLATLVRHLGSTSTAPRTAGSVTSWGAGRLDVFVIGADSALHHKWWDGVLKSLELGITGLGAARARFSGRPGRRWRGSRPGRTAPYQA